MNLLLITLGSLALLALVAALVSKLTKGSNDAVQPTHGDCSTCSGEDDRCEQVCYMEAATRDIEYYDDEELDQYKGRPSDSYNDDEVQHFADVLFSLLSAAQAETLSELSEHWADTALAALGAYRALPPETRRDMLKYIWRFLRNLSTGGKAHPHRLH